MSPPSPDPEASAGRGCGFPGCANPHHARGYCKKCYSLMRRVGEREFARLVEQAPAAGVALPGASLASGQGGRLELIKKRYEIRKLEIERIKRSLDSDD